MTRKGQIRGKGYLLADPCFVLVLGGANMDIAARASHRLAAGESIPGRISCAPGGVARNAAENLARLGHETRFISVVGDDGYGRELLESTAAAGVDVSACLVQSGRSSSCYLSLHGADGEMAMAVNDMDLLDALTPTVLQTQTERLRRAAAVLLDCNLSPAVLEWLFAQSPPGPVFVDAVSAFKSARIRPWLARIHTLKVNRQEAAQLSGQGLTSLAKTRSAAAWFIRQGVQQVAISLGSDGVFWQAADGSHGVEPACAVPVINTTGAGDALLAGLLHAHLAGEPLAQAIRFASGCAALTLTSAAANHPSLSELTVRRLLAETRPEGGKPQAAPSARRGVGLAAKSAP